MAQQVERDIACEKKRLNEGSQPMGVRKYGKKSIQHLSAFQNTRFAYHFSSPLIPGKPNSKKLTIEHK